MLEVKKYGRLSGFEFVGFLNKEGSLIQDDCPPSPHTPIYWVVPESEQWFCFSQVALHETSAKVALRAVANWRNLVQDFGQNWRYCGFIHGLSGVCVQEYPPPAYKNTKVRLRTEHGEHDVFALRFEAKVQQEAGALPSGCKMRLVPKADLSFLQLCSQEAGVQSPIPLSVSYFWQVQSEVPSAVAECLREWGNGVVLGDDAKRLLDRFADCANKNEHIWFCPPAPSEAMASS